MSLQINMSEIVRKYLVFTHSGHFAYFFNIFHIFELYGGLTLFETNIEPLFMPCFLIYSFSILHSFFGKNICLIFPVQCITAGPDYTVSQVTYFSSLAIFSFLGKSIQKLYNLKKTLFLFLLVYHFYSYISVLFAH